jgi:hypothetical protein
MSSSTCAHLSHRLALQAMFLSLNNKAEQRFVSEEFCAVLNHKDVPVRDLTAKVRTLFADLAQSDMQDPIYLVLRS